jgi:type III secretory pathway component EscS
MGFVKRIPIYKRYSSINRSALPVVVTSGVGIFVGVVGTVVTVREEIIKFQYKVQGYTCYTCMLLTGPICLRNVELRHNISLVILFPSLDATCSA